MKIYSNNFIYELIYFFSVFPRDQFSCAMIQEFKNIIRNDTMSWTDGHKHSDAVNIIKSLYRSEVL